MMPKKEMAAMMGGKKGAPMATAKRRKPKAMQAGGRVKVKPKATTARKPKRMQAGGTVKVKPRPVRSQWPISGLGPPKVNLQNLTPEAEKYILRLGGGSLSGGVIKYVQEQERRRREMERPRTHPRPRV